MLQKQFLVDFEGKNCHNKIKLDYLEWSLSDLSDAVFRLNNLFFAGFVKEILMKNCKNKILQSDS